MSTNVQGMLYKDQHASARYKQALKYPNIPADDLFSSDKKH